MFPDQPEAFIYQNLKDEDYEVIAGHNKKDGYNSHSFKYCPCCGKLKWLCSRKDKRPNYITEDREMCEGCHEAFTRNPEVMRAVLRMMKMILYKNNKVIKLCPPNCDVCESEHCPGKYCITVRRESTECIKELESLERKKQNETIS